jgi:hypothetical protein
MAKVGYMINVSSVTIPVELAGGKTVYVPPRGELRNEDVQNFDGISRFFNTKQDLSEPASRPLPKPAEKPKEKVLSGKKDKS